MPAYSYICNQCGQRFRIQISYAAYDTATILCPACQSADVQRRVSRVRFARSEGSLLESFDDPVSLAGIEEDPQAMAHMIRRMGDEMGEDLGPEFDEVVGRLESGQSPDEIEAALPDLDAGGLGSDD
jgi:putative FmdB family regulatory protein